LGATIMSHIIFRLRRRRPLF